MTTLRLPADSVEVETRHLVAASDWKDGASMRRYRDTAFRPRVFTLRRRGDRGELAQYVREFANKSARDWSPPGEAAIKVQVGERLSCPADGQTTFNIELQLIELRSTD